MPDPFAFNPTKMAWCMHLMDNGRQVLRTTYLIPDGRIGSDYVLDGDDLVDPLQISFVIGTETRRVIQSFQHIVAGLSCHEKLRWIAAARKQGGKA